MRSRRLTDVLFWALAAVALVAVAAFGALLAGALPVSSPDQTAARTEAAGSTASPSESETEPATTATSDGATPTEAPAATTTPASSPPPAQPRLATVVVSATRGDCWIQARAGSETGAVLEETVIAQGDSVQIRAAKVWLTLGASGNVDVTVNGKPRPVSSGTVAVVLQPRAA